ncbi:type II secretion system protein [Acidithiobacillus thiooxidans]|nr:prepilin-type N-terminal cleavage/methylation domain-containing protein [Acidithiobacillus thiooxidans]
MIQTQPKNVGQRRMKSATERIWKNETGLSLVEVMVSLVIASIIGAAILTVLSTVYQDRQQARILTNRIIDTAIMKQALNASVTTAGALVTSPTPSATSTGTTIPTSGNFFSQMWNMMFGCTVFSANEISNNNAILNSFFGYSTTWGSTANTGSNTNLTQVSLPATPIAVTSSTVSFEWISNNGGGQELCQGTLQISGNVMRYIVSSQNLSGGSSTCTANGQSTEEADFPIGNGWSFQPTLQTNTSCLGPAFPSQPADALVAIKAPMAGTSATSSTASTQVSVCLPNW